MHPNLVRFSIKKLLVLLKDQIDYQKYFDKLPDKIQYKIKIMKL